MILDDIAEKKISRHQLTFNHLCIDEKQKHFPNLDIIARNDI